MVERIIVKAITAADVEAWESENPQREIVNGEWGEELKLAGQRHNLIAVRLFRVLDSFVLQHDLGQVYVDGLNYVLEGTKGNIITMRIPDLSFVAANRAQIDEDGYYYLAPDLAIEIVSPSEKQKSIDDKVADYLRFGTRQVWVFYPESQQVIVHLLDGTTKTYGKEDTLTGDDLLPGFELKVTEVL
jgi:Uma2 family endonuclease